ncbi:MAG: glycosyltransferase family 2 protein [Planctomycetota bacterium]
MYKGMKVIVLAPARNEEMKIGRVVDRVDRSIVDTVVVIDDASTDRSADIAREKGATVLETGRPSGVGAALRLGLRFARQTQHDIVVILAGNNKDNPDEIPRLIDPLCDEGFDFVIGSRYLPRGLCGGDMPQYRRVATRVHPWLLSFFSGKRLTESTNGFRAFRLSLLDDMRINLNQPWLDSYGLEVYLLWKVLTLNYKHTEVPCTKIYPTRSLGYTKMKPVTGWWSILRPIFLLGLGLRE